MSGLAKALAEQGIKLPKNTVAIHEIDCPKKYCRDARAPEDATPLRVNVKTKTYAEWKCRHCLWTGHVGEKTEAQAENPAITPAISAESLPTGMPGEAAEFLGGFGITDEMAKRYRLSWDDEQEAVKIPYFDAGQEVNAALISFPSRRAMLANPRRLSFYGADALNAKHPEVIIVQRELERVVLESCGFKNVLALPAGGLLPEDNRGRNDEPDDKLSFIALHAELFKTCERVVLALDDDAEGIALRAEISRRIGPGKCWVAKFTRETLFRTYRELGMDELCTDINQAPAMPIRGLYEVAEFEKELMVYFDGGMASGVTTGWPNVDKLYTVVPGQLTVVTGIPNSGKSEWVDALTINLALSHGWRFAAFSPENGKAAHATKLIEKRVELSADPKSKARMSFETFGSGLAWVNRYYYFIESTEMMPTLDWILERAADAALRYGIKGLIIDPWNRIEKKLAPGQNETDYVAASIPRILRFLVNHGVHGWLIVHPKQQQPDHKTGKIRAPSLYDMAGSAHFVNMCDNGLVIHRSDAIDDTTEVHVKKVRFKHVGRRGETKLKYNIDTGRYMPLDQSPSYTFGGETAGDGIQSWEPEVA